MQIQARHKGDRFLRCTVYGAVLRTEEPNYYLHRIWHSTNGLHPVRVASISYQVEANCANWANQSYSWQ